MTKQLRRIGVVLAVATLAAACSSSSPKATRPAGPTTLPTLAKGPSVPGVKLIGTAGHVTAPSAAELRAAAQGEEQFAAALYHELATANGNVAIAPSSIATVLGMITAGARGETDQQLVDALHVQLPPSQLHAAIGGLAQTFAARTRKGVTLQEVDQAWLQNGRSVLAPYADTLADDYAAPLATIDFGNATSAAATINTWFGVHTHGKIKDLLQASDLEDNTALVLTDAVYLDAQWAHGFDPKLTAPAPFTLAGGSTVNVPMMHLDRSTLDGAPSLGYATGNGWKAVALPYAGGQLEMDVIVPDDLHTFEAALDGADLESVLGAIRPANVVVSMPRFDSTIQTDLVEPLEAMGIRQMFSTTGADLSGIDGMHDLYVSDVKHEVVVHVDERGTVAAGATAGIAQASSAVVETVVNVDTPFVYAVRDRATGAILFLGRITDPR